MRPWPLHPPSFQLPPPSPYGPPAGSVSDTKKAKIEMISAIHSGELKARINLLWGKVISGIKPLSGL